MALYTVREVGHVIPGSETRFPWLLGTTERGWSGLTEAIRFFGLDERSGIGAHDAGNHDRRSHSEEGISPVSSRGARRADGDRINAA